ncbi:HPP family protein [Pseudomaricurvus sp. HS19]|uniref:HPP family protein n=1 Tax=Pseudomaricurvus sp. HS19 TaxID=2692626 RepID=UPI0013711D9C|nr:HPP family protein [Pseudomaricurvus sp. HS19]MYM63890.1 HPP family protein [Pseudomaricurvus sp. HS19]
MKISHWLGVQTPASRVEQLLSTLGGVISLALITAICYLSLGVQGTLAVVPSMGAATVLLFAVPHGPLSQPWALLGGNLLSALVGVTCALLIPNVFLAAGLAVGLAIAAMHLGRCIHPPGGATALAAVIGGEAVRELGYLFVIVPVLLNCVVILVVALLFNNLFPWRRYPLAAMKYRPSPVGPDSVIPSRHYIAEAVRQIDSMVDITVEELQIIFERAEALRQKDVLASFDFEPGGVYSNNRPGADWSVRKIIDYASHPDPNRELIIYRVLEGAERNRTGSCSRMEFARWAKQKLQPAGRS